MTFKYDKYRKLMIDQPLRTEEYFMFIENQPSNDLNASIGSSLGGLFDVTASIPGFDIPNITFPKDRKFYSEYQVTAVNFPSRYSGIININFQGRQLRIPGNAALYDPLVCMIQENGDCSGLQFFNEWCDFIQSIETGLSKVTTSLSSFLYTRQIYLVMLNTNKLSVFHFSNAFPLLIGSTEFNWSIQKSVVYPVHLSFEYLKYVGTYTKGVDEEYAHYYNLIGEGVS